MDGTKNYQLITGTKGGSRIFAHGGHEYRATGNANHNRIYLKCTKYFFKKIRVAQMLSSKEIHLTVTKEHEGHESEEFNTKSRHQQNDRAHQS